MDKPTPRFEMKVVWEERENVPENKRDFLDYFKKNHEGCLTVENHSKVANIFHVTLRKNGRTVRDDKSGRSLWVDWNLLKPL